jgi:hypothetical protein
MKLGGGADFQKEPFRANGGGECRRQHLDGDLTGMLQVLGEINVAMPPRPSSRSIV